MESTEEHDPNVVRRGAVGDEAAVVRRAAAGDRTAVEVLVARYSPAMRSIAWRYRLGHADVPDVLQEVWLLFWQHVGTIREPERIAGWLRTTTQREALRVVRLRRREEPDERCHEPAVRTSDRYTPEAQVLRADEARALVRATYRLGPRDRELASAIAYEPDLSYAQLARRLGVQESSVGPLRARCLRKLRRILAAEGIGDAPG